MSLDSRNPKLYGNCRGLGGLLDLYWVPLGGLDDSAACKGQQRFVSLQHLQVLQILAMIGGKGKGFRSQFYFKGSSRWVVSPDKSYTAYICISIHIYICLCVYF